MSYNAYYTHKWDWGKEQANVENDFNVNETGEICLLGQSTSLNIVHFNVDSLQSVSHSISIIDTLNYDIYDIHIGSISLHSERK